MALTFASQLNSLVMDGPSSLPATLLKLRPTQDALLSYCNDHGFVFRPTMIPPKNKKQEHRRGCGGPAPAPPLSASQEVMVTCVMAEWRRGTGMRGLRETEGLKIRLKTRGPLSGSLCYLEASRSHRGLAAANPRPRPRVGVEDAWDKGLPPPDARPITVTLTPPSPPPLT